MPSQGSLILFAAILLGGAGALAHPVTFQGATALMTYNSPDENEVMLMHSVKPWASVGYHYHRLDLGNGTSHAPEFHFAQANFRLKRWNHEDSQANIYAGLGTGRQLFHQQARDAQMTLLSADWESRLLYTMAEMSQIFRGDQETIETRKVRFGMAPFLAEYDELSAWVIAEAVQTESQTPGARLLMRFYQRNVLWELGSDLKGGMIFNFMAHFY